jgi:CheY-like chemotaxis protein
MGSAAAPSDLARLDGLRLLVVEDHGDSRAVLRQLLSALGATVDEAGDGREALEVLATPRRKPDLILCDLRMPRMDGFALAKRLRRDLRWRRVPLVAVTALTAPGDYDRTLEAGFSAHIEKPINFDLLLSTIRRLLPQPSKRRDPGRRHPRRRHDS